MERLNLPNLLNDYQSNNYQEFISQIINKYNIFLQDFHIILSIKQHNFISQTLQTINENIIFKIDILYDYLYTIINENVSKPSFDDFIELHTFQINGYTFLQHYYTIKHILYPHETKWNLYNVSNLIDECELMKTILNQQYINKYQDYIEYKTQFKQQIKTVMNTYICNDVCHCLCEYI